MGVAKVIIHQVDTNYCYNLFCWVAGCGMFFRVYCGILSEKVWRPILVVLMVHVPLPPTVINPYRTMGETLKNVCEVYIELDSGRDVCESVIELLETVMKCVLDFKCMSEWQVHLYLACSMFFIGQAMYALCRVPSMAVSTVFADLVELVVGLTEAVLCENCQV